VDKLTSRAVSAESVSVAIVEEQLLVCFLDAHRINEARTIGQAGHATSPMKVAIPFCGGFAFELSPKV
jgi:hypothetical protein